MSLSTAKRESIFGLLFCSPWIVGFVLLFLWPFAASLYWSLCQFDLINPPEFIGLENYRTLTDEIAAGRGFGEALLNTAYYCLIAVPLSIVLGIGLAVLLNLKVRGQAVYRTLVFLPSVIPIVAASVLWIWLLDPNGGIVNYVLSWVGLGQQNWLNQARSAASVETFSAVTSMTTGQPLRLFGSKDALILMSLWGVGNFMVIYLAALNDVPNSLYEAAEIDGASPWRRFLHVTLPMLSPVIFFNLVIGLIRGVQTFTSVYVFSEGTGSPGDSLMMVSLKLFLSAFEDLRMGYASAVAWVLFVAILLLTGILFRTSRYWVHYRMSA
jgi:multiple sugar transport system permease protein